MKYLKRFEAYVDRKKYWYCTTDGIKVISGVLDMMDIDYELKYDADNDLDGILDYHELVNWDFTINGYRYSIIIDASEVDDDYDKYDGCSILTYFFTLDQNDPNYEMDADIIDNGIDLLNKLMNIKGDPWIKKINESINKNDDTNRTKLINTIDRILTHLTNIRIENEIDRDSDDSFESIEFYKKHGIDTKLKIKNEDLNMSFDFDGFWFDGFWNDNGYSTGLYNEGEIYELEEISTPSLWDIFNLLHKSPGVSAFLNKNVFKKINESNSKFKWTKVSEAVDIITKIFNVMNIKQDWHNEENLDGISTIENRAHVNFVIENYAYYISIEAQVIGLNGYDGNKALVYLYALHNDNPNFQESPILIDDGEYLFHYISKINGSTDKWIKKINESKVDKFEWTCTTEAIDIISKILNKMNIEYKKWVFAPGNLNLDGILPFEMPVSFGFIIDGVSYLIVINAKLLRFNYDGSDIKVYIESPPSDNNIFKKTNIKDGKDLYHILSKINGSSAKWMKKINENVDKDMSTWGDITTVLKKVEVILKTLGLKYKKYRFDYLENKMIPYDNYVEKFFNDNHYSSKYIQDQILIKYESVVPETDKNYFYIEITLGNDSPNYWHRRDIINIIVARKLFVNGELSDKLSSFFPDTPMELYNELLTQSDSLMKWMKRINENTQNINREKIINKVEEILGYLTDITMEKHNLGHEYDIMDSINREDSFAYTDYYKKLGIDVDFNVFSKIHSIPYYFEGFALDTTFGDSNWKIWSPNMYDLISFDEIETDSLLKILNILIQVPGVSSYLNKNIFKKINTDN